MKPINLYLIGYVEFGAGERRYDGEGYQFYMDRYLHWTIPATSAKAAKELAKKALELKGGYRSKITSGPKLIGRVN